VSASNHGIYTQASLGNPMGPYRSLKGFLL
jgi:hypothetical protein